MRPEQPSYTPEPINNGLDTLYSPVYDQTYPSKHGALIEARHVFLEGSGVAERLAQLWTPAFLARLFAVMRSGGALATYSARGVVRSGLEAVGFRTGKRSGLPGKREMLVAVLCAAWLGGSMGSLLLGGSKKKFPLNRQSSQGCVG